jgi:hypothetical protein
VKAGPDFEKARNTASEHDAPRRRLGDAAEDLEERALARAVAADDAEHLAPLDLKAHILSRPKLLDLIALDDLLAPHHGERLACEVASLATDNFAKCVAGPEATGLSVPPNSFWRDVRPG